MAELITKERLPVPSVFSRPNDFVILVLTARGLSASLPRFLSTLSLQVPSRKEEGALVQFLASREDTCPGLFHISWSFQHQTSRTVRACTSPALEYGTGNEVAEGKGKAGAQVTSSLVFRGPSLGTGEA